MNNFRCELCGNSIFKKISEDCYQCESCLCKFSGSDLKQQFQDNDMQNQSSENNGQSPLESCKDDTGRQNDNNDRKVTLNATVGEEKKRRSSILYASIILIFLIISIFVIIPNLANNEASVALEPLPVPEHCDARHTYWGMQRNDVRRSEGRTPDSTSTEFDVYYNMDIFTTGNGEITYKGEVQYSYIENKLDSVLMTITDYDLQTLHEAFLDIWLDLHLKIGAAQASEGSKESGEIFNIWATATSAIYLGISEKENPARLELYYRDISKLD